MLSIHMRTSFIVSLIGLLFLNVACYNQRPKIQSSTYKEAADPEAKNELEWKATGRGLHLSYGSKNLKYPKGKVPTLAVIKDEHINVWKGERVSLQAILWSAFNVEQIETEWDDIISLEGDTIPSDVIQTRFVRYVMSDVGFIKPDANNISQRDSCIIADPLDELKCMDLEAKTVRPLWVTIKIPDNIKAGLYTTALKVYSKSNPPQELRLTLNVLEQKLPQSINWSFQTHMYLNPLVIAHWHNANPWSDQHFAELEPYQNLMRLAGQKSITTNMFCHETYLSLQKAFDAQLIKWTKNKNGKITGDYSIFDKWIKQSEELVSSKQIDCYTIFPKMSNVFVYYDEKLQSVKSKEVDIDEDKSLINDCLKDLNNHLELKGWFERVVVVIGEGEIDDVTKVKQIIQAVNAEFKLELVANKWSSGLLEDVYAADVALQYSNLKEWFKLRHRQGKETSYHITSNTEYPNLFIHSPSAESTWFSWYAAAQGIDGIHIMNFNNWDNKVLIDARIEKQSSGSSHLIYPNARSSVRYERLIEGIQDYEKIKILRGNFLTDDKDKAKVELIDEILSDFVIDRLPRESASQMVQNGQEIINQLSSN